jgi:periplasmic glucans biosynthesis protein
MHGRADRRNSPIRGIRFRLFSVLSMAVWVMAAAGFPTAESHARFEFDNVAAIASARANAPFQEPKERVPDPLLKISYDEWHDIRFRPAAALWRKPGLPFEVQFLHAGFLYDRAVRINTVDEDGVHPVEFSPSHYDYGNNMLASQVPQDLGHAGFRFHYPLNKPDFKDEVIVFLGASYFRAVGRDQVYGLSARGLAIDTGLPSGEEFPYFVEFWLVRPPREARAAQVYALLDSRRVTGAYRFVVTPGRQTKVDVEARIYPREKIEKLGIAPLTSMFFFGENTLDRPVDFRPEVHDSDGLLLALNTGEWIWRPLVNPKRLNISAFQATDPAGFGLMQRDRDFDNYQDLEARPDLRPSVWITPRGNWGEGTIELVEIPTSGEIHDNIVAFWVPKEPVQPGHAASFAYTMSWYADDPARPPGGRAAATRHDRGTVAGAHRFVIDFTGKSLADLPADTVLRGVVSVGSGTGEEGELLEQQVMKNLVTGGWRLVFQVRPKTSGPIELRAFLAKDGETLTETWAYVLLPRG